MRQAVIFIDSDCVLCEKISHWIARVDKENKILLSNLGGITHSQYSTTSPEKEYVQMMYNGQWYKGPEVFFKLLDILGFPYKLLKIFNLLPGPVLWFIYSHIARRRYVIFGRKQTCVLQNPKLKEKFLP